MKYNFVDDTGALLAKYANEPPSVELHVHPTHYRFSNQEGIIPRNHPSIQEFLKSVEEGIILPAATEVFRDSGTRFYEGCIIISIVDYTSPRDEGAKPNSYRILLRPTDLTLWHDLLYTTDASQGRFSDQLALSMESEILNLTVRSLDLRVPSQQVQDSQLLDGQVAKAQHLEPKHRITNPKRPVRLHEDAPVQSGSALEDFLLLRTESGPQNNSNQFMRLSFIEQLKKRRRPMPGAPGTGAPNAPAGGVPPGPGIPPNGVAPTDPQASRLPNPQQIQQLQQQQQLQGQQQPLQQPPQHMPQGMPQMSPQIPQSARPQTPGGVGQMQGTPMMQQQMLQGQMSSPMIRARQLQRARMNGMTPAHAQVQQQAHAHAMRNANANAAAAGMRNMPQGMSMQGLSPQVRQQMVQQQQVQQQAQQQAQQIAQQGRQMPQNMPQGMMNYRQNMQVPQQQRVMQNQMPYSPNMR